MHSNTDEDGFVKKMTYTKGSVHDSQEMDKLLDKDHHEVYADSAYANKVNDEKLSENNNPNLAQSL